jgi:hypothetical protein
VLDSSRKVARESKQRQATVPVKRPGRKSAPAAGVARTVTGPHVSAGPYEDGSEVRLERVPGGIRLAAWNRGSLERRAPVMGADDLAAMIVAASERELLAPRDIEALESALRTDPAEGESADFGASAGRAGDMREELRVEAIEGDRLRIGRWLFWPASGWELQEAPVMLPAKRFAEALAAAARGGVLSED